jgi:hypothetical protein
MKSSSPSFNEMELTIHFPWLHFNPASITLKLDESIHKGTYSFTKKLDCISTKKSELYFYLGYVRLWGNQIKKSSHRCYAVQHTFIHVLRNSNSGFFLVYFNMNRKRNFALTISRTWAPFSTCSLAICKASYSLKKVKYHIWSNEMQFKILRRIFHPWWVAKTCESQQHYNVHQY